ncbi:MAG: response regulator [Paenibacillaceae bacterium]|nr:response regulator [Paenibacillaceae bacterium]
MQCKLLVVDDQPGIRALLCALFQDKGFETTEASNGHLALRIAKTQPPDIVLLDMKIPGMDGLQILRQLRHIVPQARVIMMTAYGELTILREAMRLGAIASVTKPFDIFELLDIVQTHVVQTECV